ncbi:hypothetical protein ANCDUO_19777 [Ancylostoma duodenale]|uniref:Thrombospondin type 1 domain protein n=1 Tax=Ancylostoma duodenale TaxID=51022 RepID=A0A0C2CK37_9BILA|nr:hypothetical protein ANCDUO_19777 [Ancylostoma duodenale]
MPTTIAGTDVWGDWGPWSECSRSCGGCGIMSRVRNCRTKECNIKRNATKQSETKTVPKISTLASM